MMKKIHISLVGGQPIPVYIGIKDDGQANTVVLVCSAQSRVEAGRIQAQFPKREVAVCECLPTDLQQIEELAHQLNEQYHDCEVTVNLTSGTKLWSLSFFRVFSEHACVHFIYVDQTNMIVDLMTKEAHQSEININTRFELYGTPLKDYSSINEYTSRDFQVMRKIERIRKVNKGAFTSMTRSVDKDMLEKEIPIGDEKSGSLLTYACVPQWAELTMKGFRGVVTEQFESEHLFDILFNSGWFELKTASELKKELPEAKDIKLNGVFKDSDGLAKNEIDIIVDFGTRLFLVECKTMVHDTTDIDKFRSALRNYSGTSSVGLFVTYEKPNEKTRKVYQLAMEKCRDNDIQTFNFALWKEDPVHLPSLGLIVREMMQRQNIR